MNTDELESALVQAERRVLKIQTKLHRWARDDPHRRFDDLFNVVADRAFLLVAWDRVSGNKGAATAGVDGRTASSVAQVQGVEEFLDGLRSGLKDRSFRPVPVRERMIPKSGGKLRRLGIPTIADRVVQASLKLVLEPIFEADLLPCSYGFRPKRRAHDAVAEVRYLATRPRCYEWVVEGDIKACFDEIDHTALMGRVRRRVGDKRVLAVVKAFLKAGILTEDKLLEDTTAGTPQGGILSPLLANIALSVLDEYIAGLAGGPNTGKAERAARLRHGLPNFKLVRYADDWCLMIRGTRADAEQFREDIAAVLATMGLRLSPDKTLITHIGRRVGFPRVAHPATSQTRNQPALRVCLSVQEGRGGRVPEDQDVVQTDRGRPTARCPVTPRERECAGMGGVFPGRGVLGGLLVHQPLPVADGVEMVTPQTPENDLDATPPPLLRRRMVARWGGTGTDRSGEDRHHPIPLPRFGDPSPWPEPVDTVNAEATTALVESPVH